MDNDTTRSTETTATTPSSEAKTSHTFTFTETTGLAALSYLGPLIIIPFILKKDDSFVAFHLKQGAAIFLLEILLYVLSGVMFMYFLAPIVSLINLGLFCLSIVGIVYALTNQQKEIPLTSKLAEKLPF